MSIGGYSGRRREPDPVDHGFLVLSGVRLLSWSVEDDELSIDLSAGTIHHAGREYAFPQIPESVRKILELGGLAAYLKEQLYGGPPGPQAVS